MRFMRGAVSHFFLSSANTSVIYIVPILFNFYEISAVAHHILETDL